VGLSRLPSLLCEVRTKRMDGLDMVSVGVIKVGM
jgi:hypothetical protein